MGGRCFSRTVTSYFTRARRTGRGLTTANENSKTESGGTSGRGKLALDGKGGVSAGRVAPSSRRRSVVLWEERKDGKRPPVESIDAISRWSRKEYCGLRWQETVRVVIKRRKTRRPLDVVSVGPGEACGIVAVLDQLPRELTAIATMDSSLLIIRAADIIHLLADRPLLMHSVFRALTGAIRTQLDKNFLGKHAEQ